MKLHSFAAIAIVAVCLIQTSVAHEIQISTNRFGVLFEDASVSEALQTFVVADIQRCYDAWGTNLVMRQSRVSTNVLRVYPRVFSWPFDFGGTPDDNVSVPRDICTNVTGQMMLKVPASLVDKYSNALAFKTNNLEKVLAADAFVDFLTSSEFANVTSNEVSNFFLVKDLPTQAYSEIGKDVLRDIALQEFYYPSILGFTYREIGPDPTNLWVFIPTALKKKGLCGRMMFCQPFGMMGNGSSAFGMNKNSRDVSRAPLGRNRGLPSAASFATISPIQARMEQAPSTP